MCYTCGNSGVIQWHLVAKKNSTTMLTNLFRAQPANSHRWLGITVGLYGEKTQQRGDTEYGSSSYEGGVTYLWLMPTGQYEMKQISYEVRCIRNDKEWMLVMYK